MNRAGAGSVGEDPRGERPQVARDWRVAIPGFLRRNRRAPVSAGRLRRPLLDAQVRRITLVQVGGIGDLIHALPVADAIRQARPDVRLTWITHPVPGQLLKGGLLADRVLTIDRAGNLDGLLRLRDALRGEPADLALNMRIYFKSLLPTLLSGAPIRLGLPRSLVRDGVWMASTHHLDGTEWKHWQDLYLDFLPALGLDIPEPIHWGLKLRSEEAALQRAFYGVRDRAPVAGVVLRTSLVAKDWPLERYPLLVSGLRDRGYRVILLGGPSRGEAMVARHVLGEAKMSDVGAGTPSVTDGRARNVRELMWKIDGLDLLISPDTGPLHIAHALDVPVVALYGRSNPWRSGPWRRFHDLLIDRYTNPGETPDPSTSGARDGRMERITVEDVLEKVDRASRVYSVRRSSQRGWGRRAPAMR